MKYSFLLILIFFTTLSCNTDNIPDEEPLARVYDEYLYLSDMKDILNNVSNKEDSMALIRSFSEKWAKKQVLKHFAEKNLSDENKDVSKELENYKNSLLIYKYQQLFISEKLDTVITDQEYETYYNAHPNEFQLDQNIIKALFIQLPKSAPNPEKVRNLYGSTKEKEISKLDEYCNKYAFKYDDFKGQWISFNTISKELPLIIENPETFIKTNKLIELSDTSYYYFLNIKEFQLSGTPAPLEFAKKMIEPILLTERKVVLLNKLENNALNEELNKKNVEIFNP